MDYVHENIYDEDVKKLAAGVFVTRLRKHDDDSSCRESWLDELMIKMIGCQEKHHSSACTRGESIEKELLLRSSGAFTSSKTLPFL